MATPTSACVSEKPAAFSSSANQVSRRSTLQKLELLALAEKHSASSRKTSEGPGCVRGGEELTRILGRQRVRVDKNAIHFVSEPARRRSSVIICTLTRENPNSVKGETKGSSDLEHVNESDVSTQEQFAFRTKSVFRMAPAAAGRTIITRMGAPRADCVTSKHNDLIFRRFTVHDSAGQSDNEREDWGGEDDAVDASISTQKEKSETQIQKAPESRSVLKMPEESRAATEQGKQFLTSVAEALHAEIEHALEEEQEAVVTTQPYDADESADVTLAVTKIQDMAATVERLAAAEVHGNESFTQTSSSTGVSLSDEAVREQFEDGRSEALTGADFDVLESLQQEFISSTLVVWLDHMKTIYAHGVRLLRVNVLGKMFVRIVTIRDGCINIVPVNEQAKSRRTVALSNIQTVKLGKGSREFRALKERIAAGEEVAEADPPATACAVIILSRNRTVSLLFMDELQRNGFVFAVRVWSMRANAALREMQW